MSLKDLLKKIKPQSKKKGTRKPQIKKENKTWQKQFLSGNYPKNATTEILKKYTNPTKGTPNKRALRSKKAREEYNKALKKFNRERMTVKKQKERDIAIREKQLAHVAENVSPEVAEKAVADYKFMLDVITTVHDDLSTRAKYEAYMALLEHGLDTQKLTHDDISKFIIDAYEKYLDPLPSFAKSYDNPIKKASRENAFLSNFTKILDDTNTTDLDELQKALKAKSMGEKEYTKYLRNLKRKQKRQGK